MSGGLVLRQLLAGRDFATGDSVAGQMANYVYAIADPDSRAAVLVDPAWSPVELVGWLAAEEWHLVGVVLTHYHADHAGGSLGGFAVPGVAELLEVADVPIHVHADELGWVTRGTGVARRAFVTHAAGDELVIGAHAVRVLHTPGHTPGSQCLLLGGALVTGDTLFLDGCGRTDLPGGDPVALHRTLVSGLSAISDDTAVYPGHAYAREPSAPMGRLRTANPVLAPLGEAEWLARFS